MLTITKVMVMVDACMDHAWNDGVASSGGRLLSPATEAARQELETELKAHLQSIADCARPPMGEEPILALQQSESGLREAFARCLSSAYVCGRVWGAWSYGTMSADDFTPADECDELVDDLVATHKSINTGAHRGCPSTQVVIGCFEAAESEGLSEALATTTDERLKDLVERRLMYALSAAKGEYHG